MIPTTIRMQVPKANKLVFFIGLAGVLLGAFGTRLSHDPSWIIFFDNLHWTSGNFAAAILAWLGWKRHHQKKFDTLWWFAVGLSGYALGQLIWDAQAILAYNKFPSPSDIFYLWLGPGLTAGLIQEIRKSIRKANRTATFLDALAISTAALIIVLVLYLPQRGNLDLLAMTVMVSYPVSLIIPACVGVIMIPAMRLRVSFSYLLFLFGVTTTAWSWMHWNMLALNGATTDGAWFNVSFSVAIILTGLAISVWQIDYSDSPEWDRICEATLRMLPIATIILACSAVVVGETMPTGTIKALINTGSVLVIILAIIRQSRLLKERDLLLATQAEALKASALLQSVIETAPIRVFWKDKDLRYLGCNSLFAWDAGYAHPDDVIGKTDFEMNWKIHAEKYRADNFAVMESGIPRLGHDEPINMPNGETRWIRTSISPLSVKKDGEIIGVLGIYEDITERRLVEEELRIAAVAFETHEAIMIADAQANIIRVNQAFQDITGYDESEVLGKNPRILKSGVQDKAFYKDMWQRLLNEGSWSGEIIDRRKDGQIYPKWLTISAVKNKLGETTQYVSVFSDMTSRKQAEEEIYKLAFHDPLTKIPNRRFLLEHFRLVVSASARSLNFGAVLFLDMDRFKIINDTLGHEYGDLMLIQVAQRIRRCVRDADIVARLGGDEFVVLLENLDVHIEESSQKAAMIAEKIRTALSEPYEIKDHVCHSTPSIGISLFCGNNEPVDNILKQADMAMYQAKDSGRNTVRFFDPDMQQSVESHAALEADLRDALHKKQLHLYYQIQVDRAHNAIGAEALVRWIHPTRGIVPPMQFIPVAEESSLILDIGQWVLDTACQQISLWSNHEKMRSMAVAINVSAHQFRQSNFVESVASAIQKHSIHPSLLKLELTESVVLDNVADVVTKMHALKELGVSLSMDDFGTGYSSLSYLKQLPLDQLKIDQSFVCDITTDPNDAMMVQAIIGMAKNLGLNVIAEGVETDAQLSFLELNGCLAYQGYLFSKPIAIEEFEELLLSMH